MVLSPNGNQARTEPELARHAAALAMFVRSHYDIARERKVASEVVPNDEASQVPQ